ncbi:hypothetical protein [Parageobacillus sp. G301]|uniref:hypothetical protein n=1 Tax=Parageobacillus sp. G301 TaxID=2998290 RepID=UPI0024960B5D|nr:hypothetical protein [Parageobacillus sp. G301]GLH62393.1 hypothetical protein PG301_02330 [Parageobacillus sp. G301]
MNIYDALKQLPHDKRYYFQYKHKLYYRQEKNAEINSDEEFLKRLGGSSPKTMDAFLAWEKTDEYRNLVMLMLQSKLANDLTETYMNVAAKARTGDEKAVKLLLQLSKEINTYANEAKKAFMKDDEEIEDDGLEL